MMESELLTSEDHLKAKLSSSMPSIPQNGLDDYIFGAFLFKRLPRENLANVMIKTKRQPLLLGKLINVNETVLGAHFDGIYQFQAHESG